MFATVRSAGIGRDVLRILIAKSRLAADRVHTLLQTAKAAIDRATGKVRAPLTVLLIVLRLREAEGVPGNEDPDCNR